MTLYLTISSNNDSLFDVIVRVVSFLIFGMAAPNERSQTNFPSRVTSVSKMDQIKACKQDIEGYINVYSLKDICPAYFIGCRSPHAIVRKRKIPEDSYTYVRLINGKLQKCTAKDPQKQTHIKISYLEDKLVFVPVAPPLIELTEDEILRDSDNQPQQVEVRGERHYLRTYFLAKDIGTVFGRDHLTVTITAKDSGYVENEDFVKMIVPERKSTEVFLTYTGFMRAIYTTRSPTARKYVLWSSKIIHTHHLGTQDQKEKLASRMIGIPLDVLKQFSGKIYIGGMPGVYIFLIGTVKELRNKYDLSADIPEDYLLLKFGRTISIHRRGAEHGRDFTPKKQKKRGRSSSTVSSTSAESATTEDESEHFADITEITELTDNKQISLVHYAYIDPRNIVAAENMIKEALQGRLIKFENRKEIIAIPKSDLPLIENLFLRVKQECAGGIDELEAEITEERHKRTRYEDQSKMYQEQCAIYKTTLEICQTMLEEQRKQNSFIQTIVKQQ